MGSVSRFFTIRNTVLSAVGMLAALMMAQATMPVAYAADPDDPRLPHRIIEDINATKAQFRADVGAWKVTSAELQAQKAILAAECRSARQESVERVRQISQTIRAARSGYSAARREISGELTTVRAAQMQLRRDYGMARRTMSPEDFAEFYAGYVVQLSELNAQYLAVRQQLSAASAEYRGQASALQAQINVERQIQRTLWTDYKIACGPINEALGEERRSLNQLRSAYNSAIRALYDELRAAREKERRIRNGGGSWTPSGDDDPNEE